MENKNNELIPFSRALELIMASAVPLPSENITLLNAYNRVLFEDVYSDTDMPSFNKSAMDGYACRKQDLKNELEIIEEIPAGTMPLKTISENQCSKIMTGAMVPNGADFVLMKEHVEITKSNKIKCVKDSTKSNICYIGEDIRKGELVLKKGELLLPSHIAILASVGKYHPLVYKLPHVAIISTGNELVEPEVKPNQVQIRNSNSYQINAQLLKMGLLSDYLGIVKDDENEVNDILVSALLKYDVVIISGGVSVGDYDYVPEILKNIGAEILIHGMNVKPGKHLLFARLGNKYIVGLPGNPVSSFVQLEVLIKPFLLSLMGCENKKLIMKLPLAENYSRKKADKLLFIPSTISNEGTIIPIEYHGSAHIHAYIKANAIMEIPMGVTEIKKGELVSVRPI